MIRPVFALLAVLTVLLPPAIALAEHELHYRYVVLGYVKNAQGRPLSGREVKLTRDKTGFSYLANTDREGFFVLVARLADDSAGEALTLQTSEATLGIVARFDPANHADARGTRVDLEGSRFIERAAWFGASLARFLAAPPADATGQRAGRDD